MPTKAKTESIADALASVVSGCFVLTLPRAGRPRSGILLSFVQQVGFDPPRITAAVRKGRPIVEEIDAAGQFVLNVAAADRDLLRRFAAGNSENAFEGLAVRDVEEGTVIDSAAAWLACKVVKRFDAGDHWLYLADVNLGDSLSGTAPYVHRRQNGLSY